MSSDVLDRALPDEARAGAPAIEGLATWFASGEGGA
jgi:hypothetical protein